MTYDITELEERKHRIELDFSDEEVDLQATTTILGDGRAAKRYVSTFEKDVRRNNRELFPKPPMPEPEDEFEDEEV